MKIIVGLGNPGEKYKSTRHNIGWQVLDFLTEKSDSWKESKKSNCLYLKKIISEQEVELIKPLTFMNNSGQTVLHVQKKHNIKTEDIIIIHDDLDLLLGKIRIKTDGSAGGHNGVQSIINHLGTEKFIRLKIGVANEKRNLIPAEKFVLQNFNTEEKKQLEKIKEKAVEIMLELAIQQEVKEETFLV
jgi:peptidyl-tRNA hydrolase, PTH1 family